VFDCSEQQDMAVLEQDSVFGYSEHRIWLYLYRVQCLTVVNNRIWLYWNRVQCLSVVKIGSGCTGTGFSVWL